VNRDELIELVERIRSGDGSEDQEDQWVVDLKAAVADPRIADYIFWDKSDPPLTADQIVDRALAYRPIEL
jgi:hypothetical protein